MFYFSFMFWLQFLFWLSVAILFYCFIGYTLLLWILVQVKKIFLPQQTNNSTELPALSFIVAAYNEKDFIEQKILNTISLNYPIDKIQFIFITDGSDDGTEAIVKQYLPIKLLHERERKGKSAALNRAMQMVNTPVTVFSDANTLLSAEALINLVKHYADEKVGGVSGEKKIIVNKNNTAMGEGLYWKYESHLKELESGFHTLVGSAGELFSVRTKLFQRIPEDIILDDFYTALKINEQGYTIMYERQAIASETASATLHDELKRKVRIAAGA